MIIYEKENKLNINFDNSTEAEPDVVISKEDGQVNIEAGGQPIGGGGSEPLIVTFSGTTSGGDAECDKTWEEIEAAGKNIKLYYAKFGNEYELVPTYNAYNVYGHYCNYTGDTAKQQMFEYTFIHCSIDSNNDVYCNWTSESSD